MAKNSMDLLELLRKRGMDGDVDFCGKPCRCWWRGSWTSRYRRRSALSMGSATQSASPIVTVTAAEIGTPGWEPWNCASQRSGRATTFPAFWNRGDAARRRCWALLSVVQQAYVEGVSTRRADDLVKSLGCDGISKSPGVAHLPGVGSGGGDFPGPALGWQPLSLRLAGRAHSKGERRRAHRERQRGGGHRRERPRSKGGAGHGCGRQRGRRLLAGLPALAERSRSQRSGTGHLRRPPGAEKRYRYSICGSCVATLPHPLHGQPAHPSTQTVSTRRGHHGAHPSTSSFHRRKSTPRPTGWWPNSENISLRLPRC